MTIKCDYCAKAFKTENDRRQHAQRKHPGRKKPKPRPETEDEPSMADLVVEARIAAACGDPVEPWLDEMFYDDIHEG